MELANVIFNYDSKQQQGTDDASLRDKIMDSIRENSMLPLYNVLSDKYFWSLDEDLVASFREKNSKELLDLDEKIEDAVTNAGDTEVLELLFSKARFFSRIGDWEASWEAYDEILKKDKTSTGKKIDATMEKAKIAMFNLDTTKLKDCISEAKKMNDTGGDWDRRNRLKVYEAYYLMAMRELKQAAALLLDCIATFTCVELCTYKQFMIYALLTSLIALDRNDLRKKVINDPHVITIIRELPEIQQLLNGIYQCDYSAFFKAILAVHEEVLQDRFLAPTATYLVREYRVLAYSQFLEAYKSVMLSSMAASFGISVELLDKELSRFIAAGRLNAKIDKVGDKIETRRPDKKNAQYHDVIKKGDHLLNQIQKLVRAIDV